MSYIATALLMSYYFATVWRKTSAVRAFNKERAGA